MASKKSEDIARKLLELSYTNGLLDSEKVSAALEALRKPKLQNHLEVLRAYLHRAKRAERQQTIAIEYAGDISDATVAEVKKSMESEYGRPLVVTQSENPSLLAGFTLRIGDDVIDASVRGRLKTLASKVK